MSLGAPRPSSPQPDVPLRLLITGGSGYLGSSLLSHLRVARPTWDAHATFFSVPPLSNLPKSYHLDLRDSSSIQSVLDAARPDVIIHTAAQMQGTLHDLTEVNARGTEWLARAAAQIGARLLHLSTDMVFDGRKGNYREDDTTHPITDYGRSKVEAERVVLESGARAVVVRTSLIYGFRPLDSRTRAVLNGDMPYLFIDELRCPIEVENLCEALLELAEFDYEGILHIAGPQALSRYEFGLKLARALGGDASRLIPTRSGESGLVRPLDCTLDCARARTIFRTRLLGVDEVLAGHAAATS